MRNLAIGLGLAALTVSTLFSDVAHAQRCSSGKYRSTQARERDAAGETFEDDDCIERDILFMPGAQAVYFHPTAGLGPFYGAGVQLAPLQTSHNNDRFGPSQVSLIAQVSMLKSQRVQGTMALFELGVTASLERNASRRWMIPYFGGAIGGLSQADLGTSSYAYAHGGIHLYYHHNLMIDAEGGYHFPFSDIDQAKGPRAELTARFSLW